MAGARQYPQGANGDGVGARQWPPEAAGGGGGVTPGGGSSGFTDPRIIVSNGGALDDESPAGTYQLVANTGTDIYLRPSLDAGGLGAIFALVPLAPAAAGQVGYDVEMDGGAGAAGSGATAGGAGGLAQFYGGFGGAGSAAAAAGRGGDVYITSGPGGTNNGGGGARGGDVFIDGSEGTGAGRAGDVVLGETTVGVWGTRYVRVGPDAGTIPLLVDRGTQVGAELLNIKSDTDTLCLLGRTAIGSWVASDEVNIAHYDQRASATGYALRSSAAGVTLINAPASVAANQTLYLQIAGSFSQGWVVGDGAGTAHLRPLSNNSFDIGSSTVGVRDYYMTRDFIGSSGTAHTWYVAAAAAGSGTSGGAATFRGGIGAAATAGVAAANGGLGTFSGGNGGAGASGRSPGSGGGAYLFGGDAGARVDTGNPSGGGVEIRAGNGLVAGTGGSVEIYAGSSGAGGTAGHILLSVDDADGTYGYIRIGASASERVGFYTTTGVAQQTGVAVTAAAIHAALVNLGLITA